MPVIVRHMLEIDVQMIRRHSVACALRPFDDRNRLIGDQVEVICPKVWDDSTQGVFENRKTNPNIQLCGTTRDFLALTITK